MRNPGKCSPFSKRPCTQLKIGNSIIIEGEYATVFNNFLRYIKENVKSTLKKIKIYMKNLRKNIQPEENAKLASWDMPSNTSNKHFWICQKNYSKKETTVFLVSFSFPPSLTLIRESRKSRGRKREETFFISFWRLPVLAWRRRS